MNKQFVRAILSSPWRELGLGQDYIFTFGYLKNVKVKLIRTSPKGYNLLLPDNTCYFQRSIYPLGKNVNGKLLFRFHPSVILEKVENVPCQ